MGKTKRIAEDQQEQESIDSKKHLEPTSTDAKTPRVIKMKGLTDEVYTQLVNYLETKSYGEVKGILQSLSQAPVLDVTVY